MIAYDRDPSEILWFLYCQSDDLTEWHIYDVTVEEPCFICSYNLQEHAELDVVVFNEYQASPEGEGEEKVNLFEEVLKIYEERGIPT